MNKTGLLEQLIPLGFISAILLLAYISRRYNQRSAMRGGLKALKIGTRQIDTTDRSGTICGINYLDTGSLVLIDLHCTPQAPNGASVTYYWVVGHGSDFTEIVKDKPLGTSRILIKLLEPTDMVTSHIFGAQNTVTGKTDYTMLTRADESPEVEILYQSPAKF